jgi:hypothetical protein
MIIQAARQQYNNGVLLSSDGRQLQSAFSREHEICFRDYLGTNPRFTAENSSPLMILNQKMSCVAARLIYSYHTVDDAE